MPNWLELLPSWKTALTSFLSAAGGVGLATKFAEKWLEAKFKKRLQELEHEQQKEIEGIRERVQWEFSRVAKIHEKEFEILPKLWALLNESYGRAFQLIAPGRLSLDLGKLTQNEFQLFVATTELSESERQCLLTVNKEQRSQEYCWAISAVELGKAEDAQRELSNHLVTNRILLDKKLTDLSFEVSRDLSDVNTDFRLYRQTKNPQFLRNAQDTYKKLAVKIEPIGDIIQRRLGYDKA